MNQKAFSKKSTVSFKIWNIKWKISYTNQAVIKTGNNDFS